MSHQVDRFRFEVRRRLKPAEVRIMSEDLEAENAVETGAALLRHATVRALDKGMVALTGSQIVLVDSVLSVMSQSDSARLARAYGHLAYVAHEVTPKFANRSGLLHVDEHVLYVAKLRGAHKALHMAKGGLEDENPVTVHEHDRRVVFPRIAARAMMTMVRQMEGQTEEREFTKQAWDAVRGDLVKLGESAFLFAGLTLDTRPAHELMALVGTDERTDDPLDGRPLE